MSTFEFKTPVSDEDIKKVHAGDVIYLTGDIVTGRDDVHHRVVIGGKEPPVDLKGKAIFHAGPIMKKISSDGEPDKYKVISVGPTTSMRMEKAQAEFIEKTGIKNIRERENALCERFIRGIKDIPGVRIVGRDTEGFSCSGEPCGEVKDPRFVCSGVCGDCPEHDRDERYTAVVSLVFDGIDAARAAFMLEDGYGILTRVGLHCAPAAHRSLGTFPEGTVRFSFGYFNTEEETDHGIEAIGKLCERR